MNRVKIILASGSPRRKELLEQMGYDVKVVKVQVDESFPDNCEVNDIAEFISNKKLESFYEQYEIKNEIVITADTIVVKNGVVLGKPNDKDEAMKYLADLSGNKHRVITGVCIGFGEGKRCFSDISEVYFDQIDKQEIKYYIDNYEILDKAGAYAIQEWIGLCKISKIVGSYTNIVGLPTQKVYKNLKEISEKIN